MTCLLLFTTSEQAFMNLFYTTFLKNRGRGESLGTTTCLETVVGVSKGILIIKYFQCNKLNFMAIIRLSQG